jgi:hypothetical protein
VDDASLLVALLTGRPLALEGLGSVEWDAAVALAVEHRLAPWLGARLKSRGVAVPEATAAWLDEIYLSSAAHNMQLFHELDRILVALRAANIPVVLLKGACLAKALYEDIALRPMGDMDLWVQRPQLDAARTVVQSLGYSARARTDRPLALQDALTGETQMFKEGAPLVELHWNIFSGEWLRHTTRIDEQVMWRRSVAFSGSAARQLSPEDAIIHLCVHLAVNHQMSGRSLRTLVDLDCARRTWSVDWRTVAERAGAWRVSCATWIVLDALAELFGDPDNQLPLRDLAPSALRQFILRRFASLRMLANGLELRGGPKRFLFLLSLVDRPADAMVLVWRALFPDRLWLTLRYDLPDAASWRIWRLRVRHLLNVATRREV